MPSSDSPKGLPLQANKKKKKQVGKIGTMVPTPLLPMTTSTSFKSETGGLDDRGGIKGGCDICDAPAACHCLVADLCHRPPLSLATPPQCTWQSQCAWCNMPRHDDLIWSVFLIPMKTHQLIHQGPRVHCRMVGGVVAASQCRLVCICFISMAPAPPMWCARQAHGLFREYLGLGCYVCGCVTCNVNVVGQVFNAQ